MGTKYFTILTRIGEVKLAEAISTGKPLEITEMGVGDGGGVLQTPDTMQTKLVNEKRRAVINSLSVDPDNPGQIIAEQVIPENEGGFWLREIGLYDAAGNLIAVANCPETYKPELKEGSGRVQTVRMILIVSRTDAVTLKFDPTVALATRRYADTLLAGHLAEPNPHSQYLLISEFVGIPQPWPQATAPAGWLKCNGQSFDKTVYPRLAQVYPSGVLPDLRGEFIRGWDDGRAVDAGRGLLSPQSPSLITASIGPDAAQLLVVEGSTPNIATVAEFNDAMQTDTISDSDYGPALKGYAYVWNDYAYSNNSANKPVDPGAGRPLNRYNTFLVGGARPRNIAFNYIVRAA
ncbi:phage tail protein [Dickeya sp. CFBP 2040]|uniref:phage tail-collar fiber domain-containing protein n=1 Tax=Dickeya sp. CFBP 2040 TaxID=2718531 RepID=UPI00144881F6|nr:phage tail protein [Dickeya sp. CFBP 2040]NKI73010.1 phage tail protein [Dickeya sp. CFBP 2040]